MDALVCLIDGCKSKPLVQVLRDDDSSVPVDDKAATWSFVWRLCKRLLGVSEALRTQSAEAAEVVVSVAQLASLKTALEIVTAWGFLPCLESSVTQRSALVTTKKTKLREEYRNVKPPENPAETLWQLACVFRKLWDAPFVGALVREGHMLDLITAYLQLAYGTTNPQPQLREKARKSLFGLLTLLPVDTVLDALISFSANKASPEWLTAAAGKLLSQTLQRPGAVEALLVLLLADKPGNLAEEGILDRTAVLVTVAPRSHKDNPSGYYRMICGQLLPCFRSKHDIVKHCAALCVERLLRQDAETTTEFALRPLLDVLTASGCAKLKNVAPEKAEVLIDHAVQDLDVLIFPCGGATGLGAEPFWNFVLANCGRVLLRLGCCVVGSVSRLNTPLKHIFGAMLGSASSKGGGALPLRRVLQVLLLDDDAMLDNTMSFALGPSGGAVARFGRVSWATDTDLWEKQCNVLCALLDKAPAKVLGDMFVDCMMFISSFKDPPGQTPSSQRQYFVMLQLTSALMELPSTLLQDVVQVLVLFRTLLGNENVQEELLEVILAALDGLLGAVKLEKQDEFLMLDIADCLASNWSHHAPCAAMVARIRDPQASWRSTSAARPPAASPIEQISDFERALKDLADSLLPVRAHALITLRKLILNKDSIVADRFPDILKIFNGQLQSDDSYIYLGAVHGLSALGDVQTADTLRFIVANFHDAKLKVEVRMKLGEAAVLIAQRCGEVLPVYAPVLMDCFLRGLRDAKEDIRASSLANIGLMCEILNFGLMPYIMEIFFAVSNLLQVEKDVLVKRAGVAVFGLIIRGAGADLCEMASREQLERVYSTLEMFKRDTDDIVRGHAVHFADEMRDTILPFSKEL